MSDLNTNAPAGTETINPTPSSPSYDDVYERLVARFSSKESQLIEEPINSESVETSQEPSNQDLSSQEPTAETQPQVQETPKELDSVRIARELREEKKRKAELAQHEKELNAAKKYKTAQSFDEQMEALREMGLSYQDLKAQELIGEDVEQDPKLKYLLDEMKSLKQKLEEKEAQETQERERQAFANQVLNAAKAEGRSWSYLREIAQDEALIAQEVQDYVSSQGHEGISPEKALEAYSALLEDETIRYVTLLQRSPSLQRKLGITWHNDATSNQKTQQAPAKAVVTSPTPSTGTPTYVTTAENTDTYESLVRRMSEKFGK